MYTKDKQTRITLRLSPQQFEFVKMSADTMGTSPSEFLRMVINMTMATYKKTQNNKEYKEAQEVQNRILEDAGKEVMEREVYRRENEETNISNKL